MPIHRAWVQCLSLCCLLMVSVSGFAATLPEDRADTLYHAYDGGGVTVDGPSVLVRKGFENTVSVYANHYVDHVSSASIDVLAYASPYTEERTEQSIGADYLYSKSLASISYTNSSESDYEANTYSFSLSQDFFGDLTTLTMSYTLGDDVIKERGNPSFEETLERRRYSLGLTQVLTKRWIMSANLESIVDEGYLQNPYRRVRLINGDTGTFINHANREVYPRKRSSDAFALRGMYYLPSKAALRAEARYFSDSWQIEAQNLELRYVHPYKVNWLIEGRVRYYTQTEADFFIDALLVNRQIPSIFGRDKELDAFDSTGVGLGITYELPYGYVPSVDRTTLNFYWDYMEFNYTNYRNELLSLEAGSTVRAGEEPAYSLDAQVFRIFVSFFF